MLPIQLKIKLHYPDMPVPQRAHDSDSGIDLSLIKIVEKKAKLFMFDTGISIEPPAGYYTELYPRSSMYKYDFIMANSVGIIDNGYRGIIFLPMRYVGSGDALAEAQSLIGKRVGQLILKKLEDLQIVVTDNLADSIRGEKGFGSSGQ